MAAEEIVDLLQAVRKEGGTDVEKLESEFTKLVEAFSAKTKLTEDIQNKISGAKTKLEQNQEVNQF